MDYKNRDKERFNSAKEFYSGIIKKFEKERQIELSMSINSVFDDIIDMTVEENASVIIKGFKIYRN